MSIRPDPFEQMEAMFDQMRRAAFDTLGSQPWSDESRPMLRDQTTVDGHAAGPMRVTLEERGDAFVVFADVPGFEREEIDLILDDSTLTITGTHEVNEGDSFRSRRVHESVHVPATIDVDGTHASYRNGVLEVTLPVVDGTDGGQQIEIE